MCCLMHRETIHCLLSLSANTVFAVQFLLLTCQSPPPSLSPPLIYQVAELIQLLIENTPSIFGEDVGGLLSQWRNGRDENVAYGEKIPLFLNGSEHSVLLCE